MLEHRSNDITVLGDVAASTRFALDPGGIRLTEAIARAGGPKNPSYEERVDVKTAWFGAERRAFRHNQRPDPRSNASSWRSYLYLERRPACFHGIWRNSTSGELSGGLIGGASPSKIIQ